MKAWAGMASSIYTFLKFTIDIAEQHSDSTVPVLDVQVWRDANSIVHSFYEKPMVSDKVIQCKNCNINPRSN